MYTPFRSHRLRRQFAFELVVPVRGPDGAIVGVFDLDSPLPNRFDQVDADGIESLVKVLEATLA
jgi:GAF domain-containing protein